MEKPQPRLTIRQLKRLNDDHGINLLAGLTQDQQRDVYTWILILEEIVGKEEAEKLCDTMTFGELAAYVAQANGKAD